MVRDIEDILPDDGIKEIDVDNTVPSNVVEKIRDTFRYEKVGQKDTNLEELLSFESKVDDVLEYLQKEGVGEDRDEVKNLNILEGRWIDRLAEQFPKALKTDRNTIERFALVAKA